MCPSGARWRSGRPRPTRPPPQPSEPHRTPTSNLRRHPLSHTVYLHIGVAKTGTTYLQRILFAHRDMLRANGLLYPGRRAGDQYAASVDLRRLDAEKFAHLKSAGRWKAMAKEVRRYDGSAVISHETLARCTKAEARRAVSSFGKADVQVVLTVRDLGRQIPAVWQETLKNRASSSYTEFLEDVFVNSESGEHKFFWRPQDVGRVVRRWSKVVGADHITLVTVPPTGAPHDELWKRFAAAIDLPDVAIELPAAGGNVSLGPAEAELLRYVNASLPANFPFARYARQVKRQLAEYRLAARPSRRIVVPPAWHDAVAGVADQTRAELRRSGCRVIGDLDDLVPVLVAPGADPAAPGPDELDKDELMRVAAEVVRDFTLATGRRRPPPRNRRSQLTAAARRLLRRVGGRQ